MTSRNLASRMAKLEEAKLVKPHRQYVYHVSQPPTEDELEAIDNAAGPIILTPHPCKSIEEWVAEHGGQR